MIKKQQIDVRVKWATGRPAKVMHRGGQVSEIKWLDTGIVQAIPNDQLDFFGERREGRKKEKRSEP